MIVNKRDINGKFWLDGLLNSYSQIFYSLNKPFALVILGITFFDPYLGICGLIGIFFTNVMAYLIGFNQTATREGLYGFGALLLGLALGYEYTFNAAFACLFMVAMLMQLMTNVLLTGFMGKHGLPVLSFPFLITYWIVSLAASQLQHLHTNELHAYVANESALHSGSWLYQLAHSLDHPGWPSLVTSYFKTLAGTFFIDSVLAGVLIAAGLLYFSRIAFSLSILGFVSAYSFYQLLGADTNDLTYHLLGSNFIFMAIGIGCFYIIPGIYSYLSVVALTPVLVLLLLFCGKALSVFHLKALTLPFSIVVTVFMYVLHQRWMHRFLHLVTIQYYSAEKTIYKYKNSIQRFKYAHLAKVALPFWGEWQVSQGYDGNITHLGDWSKALDFVVVDGQNHTYKLPGNTVEDFYCYNKPVVAPMDGYVYDIVNHVDDNEVKGVNTEQNWGNTIVMNHLNGLFSQISHLKKDSFRVTIGEYVTKGTLLATCGNSGRSPEPHLHFQLQTVPTVGAKTLAYPLAYFIEYHEKPVLKNFEVPAEGSRISNVQTTPLLLEAYTLSPGKKLTFQSEKGNTAHWEVFTDAWNRSYLYCAATRSSAYFVQDGTMFYFTDFEGSHKSLLYHFYLASYRILLGAYEQMPVSDQLPVIHFSRNVFQWVQDLFAPFYIYTKAQYTSTCKYVDNNHAPSNIVLSSSISTGRGKNSSTTWSYETEVKNQKIARLSIFSNHQTETYTCID